MAYYEEGDGGGSFAGRPSRPYEGGGGGGPRRPSTAALLAIPEILLLTNNFVGLVTDYASSMVQWMSTRQPRYKGSHKLDLERPSASYVVDVRRSIHIQVYEGTDGDTLDATSSGKSRPSCRFHSRSPSTPVDRKVKETYYSRTMDT